MGLTLALALRNLLRNRRRSLATLIALAIGAASILMFGGYSANIRYSLLSSYVRSGGHLQLQYQDFFLYGSGNPTAYGIPGYARIIDEIRADPVLGKMVLVATPTLQFGGIAGNYDEGVSRTIVGTGFVPADVNRMRVWNEFRIILDSPRFVLEGSPPESAIVGVGVARVLLLCKALKVADCPSPAREAAGGGGAALPGDVAALTQLVTPEKAATPGSGPPTIELLASTGRGTPNVAALRVVAAEGQGFKELDDVAVILHLEQAQRLVYGRGEPRATAVMVQLRNTSMIPEARRRLGELARKLSPADRPLSVLDFEELNPFYVQTLDLFDTIFGFIFALIAGIVLFTVGNTMAAAVVERTVEIGTVRAVGLRQSGIRRLFMAEGMMLGCAGTLLGAASALAIASVVNALQLTWLPPGSTEPLPLTLMIWGETRLIVGTVLGLMAIAVLSAWLPAYRAARLSIVDALRHV
jgi:putative ABC transport system permease protein